MSIVVSRLRVSAPEADHGLTQITLTAWFGAARAGLGTTEDGGRGATGMTGARVRGDAGGDGREGRAGATGSG